MAFTRRKCIAIDASRANVCERTGVEEYAYSVISALKTIIPETFDVILYSREKLKYGLEQLPAHWRERILLWPPKMFWTQLRLAFACANDRPDLFWVPAHVLPFWSRGKKVVTIHDVAFRYFSESYSWRELWYQEKTVAFAVEHADLIFVPSEQTKEDLMRFFSAKWEKISVIPHGCDPKKYLFTVEDVTMRDSVLEKYHIHRPFFLSIGRLETKKNTKRVVHAFAEFRRMNAQAKHQLVLVGKRGYGYQLVEEAIQQSPVKNEIITTGFVDSQDLPVLLSAAEAFVFPSLYEGFGMPVIEAALAGTPIIVSKTALFTQLLPDAALFVDPFDIHAIAQAFARIMEDQDFVFAMKDRARSLALVYDWRSSAQKHWEAMEKIL